MESESHIYRKDQNRGKRQKQRQKHDSLNEQGWVIKRKLKKQNSERWEGNRAFQWGAG